MPGATITARFVETLAARPDAVAFRRFGSAPGEAGAELTWRGYAERVGAVAGGLRRLGVGPGSRVALLVSNRPEFHVADVAVLLLGATPVSIYNSSAPDQIAHLVGHCGAEVAIVEAAVAGRLASARGRLPAVSRVVVVDGVDAHAIPDAVPWEELLDGAPLDLETAAGRAEPHDLVTIIYTSGTTGPPKGVMVDHANVCSAIDSVASLLDFSPIGRRVVSYLPMAHIAERVTTHYSGISFGYEVTTCADIRQLGAALATARPEVLFGVPRTYEKIHSVVNAVLAADDARRAVFHADLAVGSRMAEVSAAGSEPSAELAAAFEAAESSSLRTARQLLGLDAVLLAVASAAPTPPAVLEFFRGLGLRLSEMYGLSETTGPATWDPYHVRRGSVGRAIPGTDVRVADDGEVLFRGPNVFRGYLDDPVRTAEVLDDHGWLHTGDVGELDADGYLRIIDRKKELIVTSGGKNVGPASIESALRAQPLIGQAVVVGDGRPHLVALLVLDADVAPAWAAGHGVTATTLEELARDPLVRGEVEAEMDAVNATLSHPEAVRGFALLTDEWLADSDELTPTMKLKRQAIVTKYADRIDALYRA